jgi:class 3 adenylate cyclase
VGQKLFDIKSFSRLANDNIPSEMAKDGKPIDELVRNQVLAKAQLEARGQEIAASGRLIVVAFVDLVESTRLKWDQPPAEWLGHIYVFILRVSKLAEQSGGSVVKRIGDAVMVTFVDTSAPERFFDSLAADEMLRAHHYRIAVDYGDAFHFEFLEGLPDDPYGRVVDRCARVLELAAPATILCTRDYRRQVAGSWYGSLGEFSLRGFPENMELFYRSLVDSDPQGYLQPLLDSVNEQSRRLEGYRTVGRKLTPGFVQAFGEGPARPFLARELLNIPRLPHSAKGLADVVAGSSNAEEKEKEFIGYLVEWEAAFRDYSLERSYIRLWLTMRDSGRYELLLAHLPVGWLEVVGGLHKGQRVRVRGVIQDFTLGACVQLNYVDMELIA